LILPLLPSSPSCEKAFFPRGQKEESEADESGPGLSWPQAPGPLRGSIWMEGEISDRHRSIDLLGGGACQPIFGRSKRTCESALPALRLSGAVQCSPIRPTAMGLETRNKADPGRSPVHILALHSAHALEGLGLVTCIIACASLGGGPQWVFFLVNFPFVGPCRGADERRR